ncbi:MAG: protein BatD [Alphaproteobacteria bacterium]|nr:protein BatD [Alphaproteobacteria bacterium]MBQ9234976.1 protein BatD [Alphaproteobacteria bacterium]
MKKILCGLLINLILIATASGQSFEAYVNRNPSPEGEAVVLTLELKDVDTSQTPDFKSLSQDFTVMSVTNGYHTNIINGNVSRSRQWNLVMIPNHSGDITIPAIDLAGYSTQPIILKVSSGNDVTSSPKADNSSPRFKMSGKVDNYTPFVQQQINYYLTIYDTGGLQGDEPAFVAADDDWVIKIFGTPQITNQIINGQNMRKITYHYALFPQKSGKLTIPAVRFSGFYLTKNSRRDPFADFFRDDNLLSDFGINDIFAQKNPVMLTAQPIEINVRPAATSNGWWLPSSKVELSAEFNTPPSQFIVGEPISRTVYLQADGVLDSQLPDIKFAAISKVKQYPEKPIRSTAVENGKIVSQAKISNVYIPTTAGVIDLPEIRLNWYDTLRDTAAVAVLPSVRINVAPAPNEQASSSSLISSLPADDISLSPQPEMEQPQTSAQVELQPSTPQPYLSNAQIILALLAAFIGGIFITFLLVKLFSFSPNSSSRLQRAVISAARRGDIPALRDSLLQWGKIRYPHLDITGLQDIGRAIEDTEFDRELANIREYLYSAAKPSWHPQAFLRVFARISKLKPAAKKTSADLLPRLYK